MAWYGQPSTVTDAEHTGVERGLHWPRETPHAQTDRGKSRDLVLLCSASGKHRFRSK